METIPSTAPRTPAPPLPKKWLRWKKLATIGAVIVLLIALAYLLLPSKNNNQNGSTGLYYDRPGFDRAQLDSGIGDPQALQFKPGTEPVVYQGTAVVQACNVFSSQQLQETGLKFQPHTGERGFTRSYFDGQGTGMLRPFIYSFTENRESSSNICRYTFSDASHLSVEVYQPPYNMPSSLDEELLKRRPSSWELAASIGGLQVFKKSREGPAASYMLRSGDSAVLVRFDKKIAESKMQQLLATIAATFRRQLARPDGPALFSYDSPLIKQAPPLACDLFKAEDVQRLTGKEVSPVVSEGAAMAVGVLKFETITDNYVKTFCQRYPMDAQGQPSFGPAIYKLKTQTFVREDAAKADMAFSKSFESDKPGKVVEEVANVGDQALFINDDGQERLEVRKGSSVLTFSMFIELPPNANQGHSQRKVNLIEFAQPILSRTK